MNIYGYINNNAMKGTLSDMAALQNEQKICSSFTGSTQLLSHRIYLFKVF